MDGDGGGVKSCGDRVEMEKSKRVGRGLEENMLMRGGYGLKLCDPLVVGMGSNDDPASLSMSES